MTSPEAATDPTSASVSDPQHTRVDLSREAADLLRRLTAKHGPLMFHQSGGCCDGSSPMCYPAGEFITGDADVLLAGDLVEESGVPSYGDDCFPMDWPLSLDLVLNLVGPGTVVVPGHGAPVDRDFVQEQRASLGVVAETIRDLATRARDGKLKQDELEGGTISVTNLGMFGVEEFAAIINPPHAAILAVGAVRDEPVVERPADGGGDEGDRQHPRDPERRARHEGAPLPPDQPEQEVVRVGRGCGPGLEGVGEGRRGHRPQP